MLRTQNDMWQVVCLYHPTFHQRRLTGYAVGQVVTGKFLGGTKAHLFDVGAIAYVVSKDVDRSNFLVAGEEVELVVTDVIKIVIRVRKQHK